MTAAQIAPLIAQALVAILGAWLAATLTMRFTLKRFYQERMWERKAAAYTVILESVHELQQWYNEHQDAEHEGRNVSDERRAELTKASKIAQDTLKRRIAGETWLLPNAVSDATRKMLREMDPNASTWDEYLEAGWSATDSAAKALRQIAISDLKIQTERPKTLLPRW